MFPEKNTLSTAALNTDWPSLSLLRTHDITPTTLTRFQDNMALVNTVRIFGSERANMVGAKLNSPLLATALEVFYLLSAALRSARVLHLLRQAVRLFFSVFAHARINFYSKIDIAPCVFVVRCGLGGSSLDMPRPVSRPHRSLCLDTCKNSATPLDLLHIPRFRQRLPGAAAAG